MTINYPTGIKPNVAQPVMHNYRIKPVGSRRRTWTPKKRHSKYNARKVFAFGTQFDSKAEARFDALLRSKRANFVYHHRYLLHPHTEYKYHGLTVKLQRRSYCPDFLIWKPGRSRSWRHPDKVIDVKGKRRVTVGANRQMDDFSRIYHIPVIIARYQYQASAESHLITFKMHVRGTKKSYLLTGAPY